MKNFKFLTFITLLLVSINAGTSCFANNISTKLNLKMFIQGYVSRGVMKPVLYNELVNPNPFSTDVDSVVVELHDPVTTVLVESFNGILQTDGTLECTFSPSIQGHVYFIVVKHRSAVQTWSAIPIEFSPVTSYDFTNSPAKAFGRNMIEVDPGVWAFYNGDLDQNENVDLLDFPALESGILDGLNGYYNSDLNGDGNVDLLDFTIMDSGITKGISSKHP